MNQPTETPEHPHHRQLERAREQVIQLLSRQSVERELMARSENRKADVVAQLVERQHHAALEQRLARFHPADIAFVLESLPQEARDLAWTLVRPERRGAVLLECSEHVRAALVTGMPPTEIAAVVAPLDADDIADVVAELDDQVRQQVIERLDNADQADVRSMLSFPEGTVGAEMDLDYISVREDASLEAVLRLLRRRRELPPHTNQLFVTDRRGVLCGLLPLTSLMLGDPETEVAEVMRREPLSFYTDDRMQDAVIAFDRYELLSAPVVNLHDQIVGRLTVDIVVDAMQEQAQTDRLRQVGLSQDEDLFAPATRSARNRWPWLALNLATALLASRVIGAFEHTIAQLVALAALMPIVASIGGNTGNQTLALVIRGLALRLLGPAQLRKMFLKEMQIATLNGGLWGCVLGVVTLLLYRDWPLALVIGAAVLANLWIAAAAGVLIPLTLHYFGRDPVMGSSVMLTALTDCMGFFIFLGLAGLFLV